MSDFELILTAVSLSIDAAAVSLCLGLTHRKPEIKNGIKVGLYFGIFQMLMPIIGFYFARSFIDYINQIDHWIVFILLAFIGAKLIKDSFSNDEVSGDAAKLKFFFLIPLAITTSIDALAAGVSFALLDLNLFIVVGLIGVITFALSFISFYCSLFIGIKFKKISGIAAGLVLILIGLKTLLNHLDIINF